MSETSPCEIWMAVQRVVAKVYGIHTITYGQRKDRPGAMDSVSIFFQSLLMRISHQAQTKVGFLLKIEVFVVDQFGRP